MTDLFTIEKQTERSLSVMLARDPEVLSLMLRFYAWPEARVLDVTARGKDAKENYQAD
jgi:hypothetical protein